MPQKTWVVGEEVLAADFNTYVQNQVVPRFPTVAARDSQWPAATAGPGALCVTTDTGWLWTVVGTGWVRSAILSTAGRTGFSVSTVTPQAMANGTVTLIAFHVETFDSDAMFTPGTGTVNIPGAAAGLWSFSFRASFASGSLGTVVGVRLNLPGLPTAIDLAVLNISGGYAVSYGPIPIASGAVTIGALQSSGAAVNLTAAEFHGYRLSP